MTTLLAIAWGLLALAFVLIAAIRPQPSSRSRFELRRRDDHAALRRERLLGDVYALRRLLAMLVLVALSLLAAWLWQGLAAIVMAALVLLAIPVARSGPISRAAMRAYDRHEASILRLVENWLIVGQLGRYGHAAPRDQKLESVEQLRHLVDMSGQVLSDEQRRIVRHGLDWHTTPVNRIMTPRGDVVTVGYRELLGPLVLDGLHRSGHSRFPVVRGNLDDVIGVIDITELLEVTASKKSPTAEKAMSPQLLRIGADEPLPAVLALLQKSRQHLLIVVDAEGKTVGLVTLADITGSLLGN